MINLNIKDLKEAMEIAEPYIHQEDFEGIMSLIERAEPERPIIDGPVVREKDTFCPKCKINVCLTPSSKPNYCWCCGKALDFTKTRIKDLQND